MSHEIRTPLNAIIGMTAIGKSAADVTRKDYALGKIEDASTHLLGVINDILDMSKIEAEKFELSPVEFDLEKTLQKIVSVINFRVEEKHQNFLVHIADDIPRNLVGDSQRLGQVAANLLSNAVKFTPELGTIRLEASLLEKTDDSCAIQIDVIDTGIGITEEQQSKLFNSFVQAESNTSRRFGGTGLGLAISKRIVEMMGGRIWLRSEPGKGSAFSFMVRLGRGTERQDASQEHENAQNPAANTGGFEGRSVLIVDDVEINREILIALLEDVKLSISCAENGVEAVRIYTKDPAAYDLIFMDVQMPEMDGYEATRRIRAFEAENPGVRPKGISIVAMTANVFKEDIEQCFAAGMDDHVGKPVEIEEVLEKLRKYLG
jgi:CheY-like chemotaxis protein